MKLRFVPALLWASLIFFLSSQPKLPDVLPAFDGVDKCAHALFYGILCGLIVYAIRPLKRQGLLIAVVVTSFYGCSDEVHQMFVPGRSPDVLDWIADTLGASLAALAIWQWKRGRT